MKRFGIFLCFDVDGIIDEYVYYLLDDISKNVEDLAIVSNGSLNEESINKLSKYSTKDIIFRENIGYDAGAWRDAMLNYGFENLSEFDEIILFNDSFFGPIFPFKIMFDKMALEDVDFWGITNHGEAPNSRDLCPYGYRPQFLQTYFLVFRKRLVESKEFQEYWSNLPDYNSFEELAFKHEAVFTKYFADLGFKWKAYVYSQDLEKSRDKAMSFHTYDMYNLVVNRNLPILKRKAFKTSRNIHLMYNMVSELSKTMDYLEDYTSYDSSLIYRYFLRTMDPGQLNNILNLVKIIPKNQEFCYNTNSKVVFIAHLQNIASYEYYLNYLSNLPRYIDIVITTDSNEKKVFFENNIVNSLENNIKVLKVGGHGNDMTALLIEVREFIKHYDYFCFMNDKKSQLDDYITVDSTFRDILWENNLASSNYINGIIKEFDSNNLLGLIVPPKMYHGRYFNLLVNKYWTASYDSLLNILDMMGIKSNIDKNVPPLSWGNCFWARYDALEPLFDLYWNYADFPNHLLNSDNSIFQALERSYGYIAASKGYYTEFVMTDEYCKSELFNYSYMFSNTIDTVKSNSNNFNYNTFFGFFNSFKSNFSSNKNNIIIGEKVTFLQFFKRKLKDLIK